MATETTYDMGFGPGKGANREDIRKGRRGPKTVVRERIGPIVDTDEMMMPKRKKPIRKK